MKANELPINSFLQAHSVQFVIPVFQRNYVWTTKVCEEKIDNLPQTILSKAFKGELVEQLESDGDARELLEEIKKLKLNDKKKK